MSDDIISSANMMIRVFSNIECNVVKNNSNILYMWKKIVANNCENREGLYEHTRVVDIKHGILLVETDHPGWNQMLHLNAKRILKNLNQCCPELNVEVISSYVRGEKGTIYDIDEEYIKKEKVKIDKKHEKEQETLERNGFVIENKQADENAYKMPVDLRLSLDNLRNAMLTNLNS